MTTVMASFTTTVRQMAEMSQWPKCLSKKWPKRLSEKKTAFNQGTGTNEWSLCSSNQKLKNGC